jgi:hypothetical protein
MTSTNTNKYLDNKYDLFNNPKMVSQDGHCILTDIKKSTSIKYVNIDTKYQDEYNISSICSFPDKITGVKSIKMKSIELPISYYQFSLASNNTFFSIISDSTKTVTIPDNNYTNASLIHDISNNINAIGITINTTDNGNKTTIKNTSTNAIVIRFCVFSDGLFDKNKLKSKLGWLLGFKLPEYTLAANASITSEGFINVNPITYMYVILDEFTQSIPNTFSVFQADSYMNKNIIAKLSLNQTQFPFGTVCTANDRNGYLLSDLRVYQNIVHLNKCKIQIIDGWNNIVDLHKLDVSFCLEIEYEFN